MAEYVNEDKPMIIINETDSDFNVGVGVIFRKSGIYEISVNDKTTIVTKVSKRGKTEALAEIVRCKDCKYMTEHYDTDGNAPYWTCSEWDSGTDYDGFCHYAERRTDESD